MTEYERTKCNRLILPIHGRYATVFARPRGKRALTPDDIEAIKKLVEKMETRARNR